MADLCFILVLAFLVFCLFGALKSFCSLINLSNYPLSVETVVLLFIISFASL